MPPIKLIGFLLLGLLGCVLAAEEKPVVEQLIEKLIDEAVQPKIQHLSNAVLELAHAMRQLSARVKPVVEEYQAKRQYDAEEAERLEQETQHAREHFEEVYRSGHFQMLSLSQMTEILGSDEVNVTSEQHVYEAVMRWLRADDDRTQHASSLLELIRLRLIDVKYLVGVISEDPIILNCASCRLLVKEAILLSIDSTLTPSREVAALNNHKKRQLKKSITHEVLLVIGGQDGTNPLSSVELFDPTSPGWRSVARVPFSFLYDHAAAVLDNIVYVCGGFYNGFTFNQCISYNPLTNSWNTSIAHMLEDRADFALASLGGALYAVGGAFSSSSVERYNVTTNTWSRMADIPISVGFHSIASLNGHLYMAGGTSAGETDEQNGKPFASLYRYDPLVDSWMRLPDMHIFRVAFSLVASPSPLGSVSDQSAEGFLYAVGGYWNTTERFNVAANRWEVMAEMTHPRDFMGAALVGGDIYAVGGNVYAIDGYNASTLNTMEVLSVTKSGMMITNISAQWVKSSYAMSVPRKRHAVVKVEILSN